MFGYKKILAIIEVPNKLGGRLLIFGFFSDPPGAY